MGLPGLESHTAYGTQPTFTQCLKDFLLLLPIGLTSPLCPVCVFLSLVGSCEGSSVPPGLEGVL